jgi:hypothetical protein
VTYLLKELVIQIPFVNSLGACWIITYLCKSFNFSFIGGLNLSKVSVKGVAAALEKNAVENVESKGIKAHFRYHFN